MKFAIIQGFMCILVAVPLVLIVSGCADEPVDPSPLPLADVNQSTSGEDTFWKLIATIDIRALKRGDEEAATQPLFDALAATSVEEIERFEEELTTALYRLDGRQFAENAGKSGSSDDGFLYVRCYAVGLGRKNYEATLRDPKRMPKNVNQWFESLLNVAAEAWAAATDSDPANWSADTTHSYETGSNKAQW